MNFTAILILTLLVILTIVVIVAVPLSLLMFYITETILLKFKQRRQQDGSINISNRQA